MNETPKTDAIMCELEKMKTDPDRLLAACRIALSMAEFDRLALRAALVILLDACKGHPIFPPALDAARNALNGVPA